MQYEPENQKSTRMFLLLFKRNIFQRKLNAVKPVRKIWSARFFFFPHFFQALPFASLSEKKVYNHCGFFPYLHSFYGYSWIYYLKISILHSLFKNHTWSHSCQIHLFLLDKIINNMYLAITMCKALSQIFHIFQSFKHLKNRRVLFASFYKKKWFLNTVK